MQDEDVLVLRNSIMEFIELHRSRPFAVLREVGAQVDLKRITDRNLGANSTVKARIRDYLKNIDGPEVDTDRIRLEAKIQLIGDEKNTNVSKDRTDVILYKRKQESGPDIIFLERHGSGPGDIVYKAFPDSVLAAVEIKANPSHQSRLRQGYALDIVRLLKLKQKKIFGFFLILDKSKDLYRLEGDKFGKVNKLNWEPNHTRPSSLSEIVGAIDRRWENILISSNTPNSNCNYIEIWDAAHDVGAPRQLFAYETS